MRGIALVTGGARRIGRTIALALAEAGWDIALHYHRSEKEARETAQMIAALGSVAHLLPADLCQGPDALLSALAAKELRPDVLINNASLFVPDTSPDAAAIERVNLDVPCQLTEHVAATLPADASAGVIHLLDGTPIPAAFGRYRSSKKALAALVPDQARRLAPRVRVNGLLVGPALRGLRESREHFSALIEATPLNRPSPPEIIAKAVLFLIEATPITGALLPLDSGVHLYGEKA
jgi:NAD(P)-dependent dehydrogenase (short-subunit alcohol dehydrogenase family)